MTTRKAILKNNIINKQLVITRNLMGVGKEHTDIWMKKGLKMLKLNDKEDTNFLKLRVVDKGHGIWIIEDPQAITLLEKGDY